MLLPTPTKRNNGAKSNIVHPVHFADLALLRPRRPPVNMRSGRTIFISQARKRGTCTGCLHCSIDTGALHAFADDPVRSTTIGRAPGAADIELPPRPERLDLHRSENGRTLKILGRSSGPQ